MCNRHILLNRRFAGLALSVLFSPIVMAAQDNEGPEDLNHTLERLTAALRSDDSVAWDPALKGMKLLIPRLSLKRATTRELLAKSLVALDAFAARENLDQRYDLPLSIARRQAFESEAVRTAVELFEKGNPNPKDDDKVPFSGMRSSYLADILEIAMSIPTIDREASKSHVLKLLSRIQSSDQTDHALAIEVSMQFKLTETEIVPILLDWITPKLSLGYMRKLVVTYSDHRVQDRVLSTLAPWDKKATDLDREQQMVLSAIQPSTEKAQRMLELALRDLFDEKINDTSAMIFFPYVILKNVALYQGMLSDAQQQRIVDALPKSKGTQTALLMWFILLGRDKDRNLKLISDNASHLAEQLAQWDYLPKPPENIDIAVRSTSTIDHFNDLFVLAMMSDLKLDGQAVAALEKYSGFGGSGANVSQWRSGTNKMLVNHWAAYSLLWRNSDPKKAVETYAGRLAREEWYQYGGSEMPPYALAFAGESQGTKGEPEEAIVKAAKLPLVRLDLAMSYPESEFARNELPNAMKDVNLQPQLINLLYCRRSIARPLAGVPGLKQLVLSLEKDAPLQVAGIVAQIFDDKEKALSIIEPIIRQKYFPIRNYPMKAWGPYLEIVLEANKDAVILDEFTKHLEESLFPARNFVLWLLKLRRGKDAGNLPLSSFQEVWNNPECTQIMIGLSRAGEAAIPYLRQLRSPYAVQSAFAAGIESILPNPNESAKVLAFMGALDRIEWLARGLSPRLEPPIIDFLRQTEKK